MTATIDALVENIRADLPHTLIAVDFDGTLAPIVPDPNDSRPLPGAVEALRDLAERGAQIAVITGRDAATVVRLADLERIPGIVVEGLYGVEQWRDGRLTSPDTPEAMTEAAEQLPALVAERAGDPAVWIEDKRLSFVVHGRLTADPEGVLDPLRRPVAELAQRLGLEFHEGRGVLELRLPGYDKGAALQRVVDRIGPVTVLFVGDDLGDLPAFELVRDLRTTGLASAWGVVAASDEVPAVIAAADLQVDGPHGVLELLAALAG